MSTPPKSESPIFTPDELTEADGFVFGFPTRYGMMAAQFKVFLDTTGGLRRTQSLAGKPAGSSTAVALKVVAKKPLLLCHIEEVDGPAKAARGEYCDTTKPEDLNEGVLLATPEKVAQDQVLAFKASFWYWTTKVRSSFKSGFGPTIKAVNSMECTGTGVPSETAANRIRYFQDYCMKLDVLPGENLTC
ncbi:hypothetical protein YC2023_063971 [Brassica napus]